MTSVGGRTTVVTRVLVLGVLVLVLGLVAMQVLRDQDDFVLHAQFSDAGQLVQGAEVRVAGRDVGTVPKIRLTPDGEVDVELRLEDDAPVLRRGTRATIRAAGQAGVASRYIELEPGPQRGAPLVDGAVLTTAWTSGIVDLDALLDTLGGPTSGELQNLISRSSQIYAGAGGRTFNAMLRRLDPAMAVAAGLGSDLAEDDRALAALVRDSAIAADAVASQAPALERSVSNSAEALGALAAERRALTDVLERAPGTLRMARGTLQRTANTVRRVRPALRELTAVTAPLQDALRALDTSLTGARPVLRQLRTQLPDIRASLLGVRRVAGPTIKALDALGTALGASYPIVRGLRIYGADFVLGVTNGLAGIITSNYNRVGHYGRLNFVENPQTVLAGIPSSLLSSQPLVPGLLSTRTGVTALCPGGNQPPAPDGSNRVVEDPALCEPSQSIPASVNGG